MLGGPFSRQRDHFIALNRPQVHSPFNAVDELTLVFAVRVTPFALTCPALALRWALDANASLSYHLGQAPRSPAVRAQGRAHLTVRSLQLAIFFLPVVRTRA